MLFLSLFLMASDDALAKLLELASTPAGHFLLVGAGMLVVSRLYPAALRRWPALAPYLGLLARLFPDAAPRSGRALWELYSATMKGRAANGSPLPTWDALDATQRAAYEAMAHGLALAPTPANTPGDDDGPKPGAPPPSIVTMALGGLLAVLLVSCMGCVSPLATAGTVADATAATLTRAQPLLHEVCTAPMQGIAALPDATERKARALALHDSCGKPMAAYDALRRTHVMLLASIAAAAGGGVTVGELLTLTQRAVDDAAAFADAAGGLR